MKTIKLTGMILMLAMLVTLFSALAVITSAEAANDLTVTIDKGTEVTLKDSDSDGLYDVGTADELYAFAAAVIGGKTSIHIELTANITVNENVVVDNDLNTDSEKVSAFRAWPYINSFNGIIDGKEYTISGLYISEPSASGPRGFIGYTYKATIKNLTIADSYIHGNQKVGMFIGSAGQGTCVVNCKTSGVVKGSRYVGGFIGTMFNSLTSVEVAVDSCVNNATVTATEKYVGGILGDSYEVVIQNCLNKGDITGVNYIGGIVGYTKDTDTIKKSTNLGKISGTEYVGGIAGTGAAFITECINKGDINGSDTVGGIAGMKNYSAATFSYNEGSVSGTDVVGGLVGNGSAENCYNFGSVSGTTRVGGIAGYGGGSNTILNCYNAGTVSSPNPLGLAGEYYGTIKNSFYLSTVATSGISNMPDFAGQMEAKTAEEFASGEVAFYLIKSLEDGSEVKWGQNIDGDQKDAFPLFVATPVYCGYDGCNDYYSNTIPATTAPSHSFTSEGFCSVELNDGTVCGAYQPAPLVDGAYQISNAGQLYWFAAVVNHGYEDTPINEASNGKLVNNITVNTGVLSNGELTENSDELLTWLPIGSNSVPYTGSFDGANYTISGIYINGENNYVGLFGSVDKGAYIHDLTLTDSYIRGGSYAGGIAGKIYGTQIENCHSSATIYGNQQVGGIAGISTDSSVKNSVNSGNLFAKHRVGGIVGYMYLTDVIGCINIGHIEISSAASVKYGGGIVGYVYNSFNNDGAPDTNVIENCYALGTIKGGENIRIGGIVAATGITVKNCFSGITIESDETFTAAMVVTILSGGSITDSYYDNSKNKYGVFEEDDYGKSRGRTPEQLATGEVAYLLGEAWGQKIGTDAYPVLGGDTVYAIEGKYCTGTPSGTYIYSNDANTEGEGGIHSHNAYGYCELCEVKITGALVTVGTDLTMSYFVELYDASIIGEGQNIAMIFTFNDRSVIVTGVYDEIANEYIFAFEGIAPQCMADTIDANLVIVNAEYGNIIKDIAEKMDYSIKAYAEALLEKYSADTALVQLVTDMLTYGAAAQQYAQHNTDALVTDGVVGLGTPSSALPENTDKSLTTHVENPEGVRFTAATVWFDNVNKIGVKLSTPENARLFIDGVEVTLSDELYYYTEAIYATEFDKVYTFELYEGETLIQTLTYSVSSYVYSMMGKTEADGETPTAMAELAKTLYNYGASAKAYKNS